MRTGELIRNNHV